MSHHFVEQNLIFENLDKLESLAHWVGEPLNNSLSVLVRYASHYLAN